MSRFAAFLAVLGCWPAFAAADEPPLSHYYGFLPPEIYKLDQRTQNAIIVDINSDGLDDIVVVNNLKNQIDVLQQRKDPKAAPAVNIGLEVNEIASSNRLLARKIPMQRSVASLVVKDVNGDKRPDLVYIGTDPTGLYVEYQDAEGGFTEKRSFEIEDALAKPWSLDVGDVNGDGLDDIVFLGKEYLYVVTQSKDGKLEDPKKYKLSGGDPGLLRVLDVDGDGRIDVVYVTDDPLSPVRIRFQSKQGRLGPEHQLEMERPRSVSYAKINPSKPGMNMLTISELSSRLMVYGLTEAKKKDGRPVSQVVTYPFDKTGASSNTDLAVADFDGDGKTDVIVTDANGARVILYRQTEAEGLDLGHPYPTMLGTSILRTVDLAGDKKAQLLSLSTNEKAIGLCRFEHDRLSFPQVLPTKDEPVAMEVLGTGPQTTVVYVARVEDAQNFTEKFYLRALKPTVGEEKVAWKPLKLGGKDEIDLGLTSRPSDLRAVDANGDGVPDLMIFQGEEEVPTLWLGGKENGFTVTPKTGQGTFGAVKSAAVFFKRLDGEGSSLLVAQNNFARRMKFEQDGRWRVVEQINAPATNARIAGVEAIDIDGDGKNELAMYDRASQSVVFLKQSESGWTRLSQLKVGSFNLKGMRVADLNGDGKPDLLLYDGDKMGVVYNGKADVALETIAVYEPEERRGKLYDTAAGDLNHDGRVDILAMDSVLHELEIIDVLPGNKLKRALRWPVFEEKTFRQSSGRNIEPREIVIGDVNGDGRNDVVVLVHDRVLVYLQDPGSKEGESKPGVAAKPTPPDHGPTVTSANPDRVHGVKDEANFFKPETLAEAQKLIASIKTEFKKDVVVETFPAAPAKYNWIAKEEQHSFMENWANKRKSDLKINGVYVLICKKPGHFEVRSTEGTLPESDLNEMRRKLLKAFHDRHFDDGLLEAVKEVRDSLAGKSR